MSDLGDLWDSAWSALSPERAPQGLCWPVLATHGFGGGAEARMVVLRRARRAGPSRRALCGATEGFSDRWLAPRADAG